MQPDALFAPGGSDADYVGFTRSVADIKRIEIVAGSRSGVSDGIWIDNLAFVSVSTPVPSPGSLGLTLTALLFGTALRRRKT
ncbi:MAG: PEP-CTERM sorting domain-containing protein [Pseudomonadota bacterium]|nr:PEP-CTERM sorting domain-containing protein [Pseudomonadota bacterium]